MYLFYLDKTLTPVNNKNETKRSNTITAKEKKIVDIGSIERIYYIYFGLCCFSKNNEDVKNRKELMEKAEEIIEKKSDIFELFKLIDQFKLIKKLTLNENQYFLLNERDKRPIIFDANSQKTSKELEDLNEAKYNIKKENLKQYLKRHKETNSLTSTDILLLKYANKKVDDLEDRKEDRNDEKNNESNENSINNHFE